MFEDQTPTQFFTPSGRLSLFLILLLVTIFITLCILFCCRDFLKRMRNLKRYFFVHITFASIFCKNILLFIFVISSSKTEKAQICFLKTLNRVINVIRETNLNIKLATLHYLMLLLDGINRN